MIDYYTTSGVLKGELVLLIAGAEEIEAQLTDAVEKALQQLLNSVSTKEASSLLSDITGIPKKILYNKALELRDRDDQN